MIQVKCPHCGMECSSSETCAHMRQDQAGIWECVEEDQFYWNELSRDEAQKLLTVAEHDGWREALAQKTMADDPNLLNYNKADWFFYLPGTIKTCLDIGSGLGAIPFILSEWTEEVWSLERVAERLKFQAIRAAQEQRTNLRFIRSKAFPLPFPDDSFDLVSMNGVLEWIGLSDFSKNPKSLQQECLQEVYRILRPGGVVYIGIEGRFGLQYLLGAYDHSSVRYTSLVPRKIADVLVRKFRERSRRRPTHRSVWHDYRTYTYTHSGYRKLLRACGFGPIEFCWALPGYSDPRWSGRLDEKEALAFFVRQLDKNEVVSTVQGNLKKWFVKTGLSHLGKTGITLLLNTRLYKYFMPSYVIFAYKNHKNTPSFDERVKTIGHPQRASEEAVSYLRRNNRSRRAKLTLYGVDKQAHLREFTITSRFAEYAAVVEKERQGRQFNTPPPATGRGTVKGRDVVAFEPFQGRKVNFSARREMFVALDWLLEFQAKTLQGTWEMEPLTDFWRNHLKPVAPTLQPFVEQAVQTLSHHAYPVKKVGEHGDFCSQNILIAERSGAIFVVDWEVYQPTGDELFDFVKLIVDALPDYLAEAEEHSVGSFIQTEPIASYIAYWAEQRKIPSEIIAAYIPICLGRVAARHFAYSGKNTYFERYMDILQRLASQEHTKQV